jgi:hypothetical protein
MNREDIIRMAREAGFDTDLPPFKDETAIALKLAKLVAEHEREACAKVCDNRVTAYKYATDVWAQEHIDEARHLANAIRARGQA